MDKEKLDEVIRKQIDSWPEYKKEAYNNEFAISKYAEKLDTTPLKRYIATWFNYIAQGESPIYILANNREEASMLAVMYMDSKHPHHEHDVDDIFMLTSIDEYDMFYTKKEIEEMYLKTRSKKEE